MTPSDYQILVVDDNLALASVVRFNLQQEGYEVSVAYDGQEAWEQAQTQQFDLIITDQQMPRMSGCELCAKLRETVAYAQTPIIMLTAKTLELDPERLRSEYGITAHFSKPFSPGIMLDAVHAALDA